MGNLSKRFPRYSKLLWLYPPEYRNEYGEQMLQTLADMLDNSPRQQRWQIWLRATLDLPLSALKQQLVYEGGIMTEQMPLYIKRNAQIGAWMVAPFFLIIALNSFAHDKLHHSVLWHSNVLFAWLVLLPAIAIILNVAAWLRWTNQRHRQAKTSLWRSATDLHHNWPVVAVALVGLGILALVFGHDSAHCLTGNPLTELSHRHQTLMCLEQRN